ncbi:alkene reductase (plasmid) [Agrobacterium tumefaciens]|uniref:Alkene reductase n=1 Tax=Agrobacterium tumefaciens TaxID=358 RepID=A0AAP9EAG2_AGRTU|nr:alkene reductase [Agrobacterium tumefaciens]NSZ60024.1 alkene reductase [Agrobacterium tumefaciens]QDY97627.1 alkene reductase [Agrobacterium tumefaciens]UXS12751.1 alkene reductase [Agrobacterium tumefaciens]UXS20113.1 alkene reductase [Agrobacterium tumefaciens]UXS27760.1 alkene reductase [Agrobacterium tumefaciens]
MGQIFTPVRVGRYDLSNRLVMAPMTRSRAGDDDGVIAGYVADYYGQRSGAGLIISEGVYPSASGKGYVSTPGIETDAQVEAWRKVTDAVHAKGSHIFIQVMHCGRISHPSMQPDNALPVAPSAIKPAGETWTSTGQQEFLTPHALTVSEIQDVVADYRTATRRALEAGFDGVELHAASGYLPEQFMSNGTNKRGDEYGGTIRNRIRFVLEVLAAMIEVAGGDRVGIKISPEMNFNDVTDDNPQALYWELVEELNQFSLAYLHLIRQGTPHMDYHALLRPRFKGPYLMGAGLTKDTAEAAIVADKADAVVFGELFLANPDLPQRFQQGAEFNAPDRSTYYGGDEKGYTDYPIVKVAELV